MSRTSKQDGSFLEYAAFKVMLSVCARMNDSERRHLLMWLRKLLTSTDKKARLRLADRIADVYGKPAGFARKVRHVLHERHLSNQEFALMLRTTAKHVSQWLNGVSSPSRAYLLKVAHLLDLDPEEIDSVDRGSIAG